MNPVDHSHGGDEGRAPIGRKKTHNPLGLSCAAPSLSLALSFSLSPSSEFSFLVFL
ncbi:hypothetical protein KSP39_PZI000983 [Platanthera zijinensis]|uniref:Ribosomal protein L2 n=1 Tax=Platanthera zijinensis TaxID=2320716 RepID=A0AAP0GFP5_9ASPA